MILRVTREDLSSQTMQAVLSIQDTLSRFPLEKRLAVVAECVLGVLRGLRLPAQTEPKRQKSYDALAARCRHGFGGRSKLSGSRSPIEVPQWTRCRLAEVSPSTCSWRVRH